MMTDMRPSSDFYEDDEPVEKIIEAFERGQKGVTARTRGWTQYLQIGIFFPQTNEPSGHAVAH